jgi:hypothetical protein
MIDHLNWESLEQRRQKARVIMLYEIIHNEVDINPQSYLKNQERTTRSTHPYQFQTYSLLILFQNTGTFCDQNLLKLTNWCTCLFWENPSVKIFIE